MLEWLSSKFAMLVAVTIMISSVLGFFKIQFENFETQELQNIADTISSTVNTVSSSASEFKLRITFNLSRSGIKLPSEIGGRNYKIEIAPNLVIVTCDNVVKVSTFAKSICLWNPQELKYITAERLEAVNSKIKSISCRSYEDFFIANRAIDLPEGSKYLTFVYLERSELLQKEANMLSNEINDFVKTTLNASTFNIKKEFVAPNQISFYRGILIMNGQGLELPGFINCDYLWNPAQNNISNRTTWEYLNITDRMLGSGFELNQGESFYVERRLLEIIDVALDLHTNKTKLFTFLYA
ncbi:MAG: hypothetical protein QMC98_00910 [Candidatus Thermoplasmatota archaeon]|nr:hypothetical protein [Candidatus Thermoplasmatota archaeon]